MAKARTLLFALTLLSAGVVLGRAWGAREPNSAASREPPAGSAAAVAPASALDLAAIRRVVREELAQARVTEPAQVAQRSTAETHVDNGTSVRDQDERDDVLDAAEANIARALTRGVWTREDASLLREAMSQVSEPEQNQLIETVLAAVNAQ